MPAPPAIVFDRLRFAYTPARGVLDAVSGELAPGRVTAIVGPNGSGKTTLLRLTLGLLTPGDGSVRLAGGEKPSDLPEPERAKRLVSVPQRSAPAFGFTALEVAAMGAPRAKSARARDLAAHALERVGLADRAGDASAELSVGQQQRVTLARALVQFEASEAVEAVLADEPVSAMDPLHALQTLTILKGLAARGPAVAIVLHDLTLAARFADDALVLARDGSVAASGPVIEVLRPRILGPVFGVGFEPCDLPLVPVLDAAWPIGSPR